MTLIFGLAAGALVIWGFWPGLQALMDVVWPDEQRVADEEWAALHSEIEIIEREVIGESMNRVRAGFGMHRF
jgi:hypothetical protein